MSRVIDAREKLAAKQAELHALFSAYPDLDMPDDVATDIKTRNDELTDLAKEYEKLRDLEALAKKAAADNHEMNGAASRPAFGSANSASQTAEGGGGKAGAEPRKSLGTIIAESDAIKSYSQARRTGPESMVSVDDVFGQKTLLTETGFAPQAVRTGLIIPGALRRPVVADLIPQGTTDQVAVVYMEETTTTNAAAFTAEGAAKPESALAFTERTAPVRKIATVLPITDELLKDVPAFRAYVEGRMRIFLQLAEESALITGSNNTAPNFAGMLNVSGIQTQAKGTDPTPDAIYKAMVLIQTVSYLEPSGVIFNPLDWQDVRLLRTADGLYIWGSPADPGPERIWGLPVVATTAMTQNTALVAAFETGMQIFRREGVSFMVSDQNEDFFIKNKLMLRVEERLALAVYRPSSICQVTGV